jgi:hypothetical protein
MATGNLRNRLAAHPRPAVATQVPTTTAPPTMFSFALHKIGDRSSIDKRHSKDFVGVPE